MITITDEDINVAFQVALDELPELPTLYQNWPEPDGFDPGLPHQKCWLLPARNKSLGLSRKRTLRKGIFQVNLCYPSGKGTHEVGARAGTLQTHFYAGRVLVAGGVQIRITDTPSVAAPTSFTPYTVPVSIDYECIN